MKVLIAEDTADLNRVLTVALEHQGYDVDSALDGQEASDLIDSNGYDVIILDIMMPKKDGITVLKELRAKHIITPVLLLTAKTEVDDRVTGLDSGADDYLTKPFAMKELLARVRAMVRRKSSYEGSIDSFADLRLDSGTCELKCENAVRLSVKEFELLQYLIRNAGTTMSTAALLNNVWNNSDASEDTILLYVMYLQGKLRAIASQVTISGDLTTGFCLEDTV
ncbi:MAG: response regulator transcription factor [Eubacteriales bacterium]|nr:response regulator transcription factor [Eubacteriales bacterium]